MANGIWISRGAQSDEELKDFKVDSSDRQKMTSIKLYKFYNYIKLYNYIKATLSINVMWLKSTFQVYSKCLIILKTFKENEYLLHLPCSHHDYQTMWFLICSFLWACNNIISCPPDGFSWVLDMISCTPIFSQQHVGQSEKNNTEQ